MVNKTLTADIDDIITACEQRMLALIRQSVQDVVEQAQTATGKGGRMRVDTGFLRASGQMSLTGMPSGPGRGESKQPGFYDTGADQFGRGANVELVIGQVQMGSTIFFGWTANYARYREAYDGFLEGAVQNWQKIVDRNVERIRKEIQS